VHLLEQSRYGLLRRFFTRVTSNVCDLQSRTTIRLSTTTWRTSRSGAAYAIADHGRWRAARAALRCRPRRCRRVPVSSGSIRSVKSNVTTPRRRRPWSSAPPRVGGARTPLRGRRPSPGRGISPPAGAAGRARARAPCVRDPDPRGSRHTSLPRASHRPESSRQTSRSPSLIVSRASPTPQATRR